MFAIISAILSGVEGAGSMLAPNHFQHLALRSVKPDAVRDDLEAVASFGRAQSRGFSILIFSSVIVSPPPFNS
jgi:hypothetical protein